MSRVHCVLPEDKHKDCFLSILNILLKFTLFLDSLFRFSILWGDGGDVKMTKKRDVTGRGSVHFLGMRDGGVIGGEGESIFPDFSVT